MSKKQPQPKRQRTENKQPAFGAPTVDDVSTQHISNTSSSLSSTRNLPSTSVPALTTLCARKFVANFVQFHNNEAMWRRMSRILAVLPEPLVPRMFAMLKASCPTFLKHETIVTYFLRGSSVVLSSQLPGVVKATILDIPRINPDIQELELSEFSKLADTVFATALRRLLSLRVLVLRGCTKVGAETIRTVSKSCPRLRAINLNYTSVSPVSLLPLIIARPDLEVIKVAGINSWTDATFANLIAGLGKDFQLVNLHTLKFRQTMLSDVSLSYIIALCPNLKRLDVSFTLIKHPSPLLEDSRIPALEKLSLTSTSVSHVDLVAILVLLPQLRTLSMGALGVSRVSRASIRNSTAMTMDDKILDQVTSVLEHFEHLEHISLVGNTKLGISARRDRALERFIKRVGRKCKTLSLVGIPNLISSDLTGLAVSNDSDTASSLVTLLLNNTSIGDEAAPFICSCLSLESLGVAGTKITRTGLFAILDSCSKLESLDLTSCRGVNVSDRRRFFQVWEEERLDHRS